ncbi:hypothetical protein QJQ45_030369 [Haematococcus lacustris]|nr:hypothetical protein QJQ45_030369 [Haematococcus lacustris]
MLSEEELGRALQGCAHSKAPGLDGLPMEVYDRLWVELGRPLRAMLREALADTADPAPLAEFLTGIITLVPKAGKPRDQVAGYRPITLLNCDVRLVARAVEDRLQLPLDLLVSPSQSAFILGRDISDSVQFHLGLLEYLQQRGSPAWLLLLDLAGAYDDVSWGLLQDTMEAMGFCREGHVRWAQLLHRGATSQVLVNGHLTDSFPLASGLLQGSGASPLYWCIVLQPLVSYLSSLQLAGRISTPTIPSSPLAMHRAALTPALPSKEYADDLTIVVLDRVRDGKVVVEALGLFRAAGGPALSVSKSSALPCAQPEPGPGNQEGSGPEGAGRGGRGGDGGEGGGQGQVGEQGLGGGLGEGGGQGQQQGGREQGGEQEPEVVIPAVRAGVPVRHLGVPLGAASYTATSEAAFGGAAAAMMAASLPWRPQGLNLLGRVQVAQQCLASKSIYQMAFVQPSAPLTQAMAAAVNRFVAASDLPQERSPNSSRLYPSKAICVMPRGEGGVGLPDLGLTSTTQSNKRQDTEQQEASDGSDPMTLLQAVKQAYGADKRFDEAAFTSKLHRLEGLWLTERGQVVVPNDEKLRRRVIHTMHDAKSAGHLGMTKTLEQVTRYFDWHGVSEAVKHYVRTCHSCQLNKSSAQKPAGKLQPLPISLRPWGSVSLDLIVKLPASGPAKHDSILVIVDRLTKMVHLARTWERMTAVQYAKLFVDNVFRLHGWPDSIVSDRGPNLNNNRFFVELAALLQVDLDLSSAYHPQTDGQTERMNRVIEEMLRHYIRPDQKDWAEHLPLVEFAINNAKQESTRCTPFYLNYGYHPRVAELLDLPQKVPQAHGFVANARQAVEQARQCLARAQKRMKAYQDTKRRDAVFEPGDMVLLSTQNMRGKVGQPGARKLKPRYVGPFRVEYMVGRAAVKLDLPEEWSRIHNVFHVSLVKPYRTYDASDQVPGHAGPPPLQWLDGEPEYKVEKVVDHRLAKSQGKRGSKPKKRQLEFLVKWQGHGDEHNTWESRSQLVGCQEMLTAYLQKLGLEADTAEAEAADGLRPDLCRHTWNTIATNATLLADPSHGLSTWVITDPTAPPSRGISPRLQAHVAALAELKLFRAVPPASQSFFSVLAEPLWYNAQVRMNPAAREAAAEQGWTHVRHVREALHSPQLEGDARWAADLVRACLPEPWQSMVDRLQPPQPEWECLRVGPGVGFVMRRTPLLQHWVGPNGRLYSLDPTGQGPLGAFWAEGGAAWEPAAVARLNKPSYRLTPEERATHLRPLPAQHHVAQEQAQGQELGGARGVGRGGGRARGRGGGRGRGHGGGGGRRGAGGGAGGQAADPADEGPGTWPKEEWLLGPWAHLQLDPQVWGMGTTTLLDFSVKHARVRLHQLQRVSADPLYPPGGGLWPALWGVRPPRAAGEPEVAAVADGALRELELKWEASVQQVAGQGAAGEREQQGRDVEERLHEEVQGSQPPRWLDTSARAHQRPSPQMRAAQQAERQLEAQQRRGGRQSVAQPAPRADTADQLAVGVQAGQPCAKVWKELLDPTLRREHVIVAWRVLHASLMVGALWGHILKGMAAPGSSACRFCQPGHLETLTHAFLTCPAVVPAWEWVLDVYGRLTGTRPPSGDAMLLLSGRPTRGEAPPFQPPDSLLWLRLRVAYLGAVWRLRSSGAATALQPQQVARRVVEEVISTLTTAVKRDWHRVGRDIRVGLCGAVPSTWFKGKDPELDAAHFDQLWPEASGGWFAKQPRRERRGGQEGAEGRVGAGGVEEERAAGRPRHGEGRAQGGGELVVRLSLQWPVPFPVEPA